MKRWYRVVVYYEADESYYPDFKAVIINAHNVNTPTCTCVVREIKETCQEKFERAKMVAEK